MDSFMTKARDLRNRTDLYRRLTALEEEVQECRQLNLRLAELCDVMMELLLPAAQRDDAAVAEILARYQADVSDPNSWAPERAASTPASTPASSPASSPDGGPGDSGPTDTSTRE